MSWSGSVSGRKIDYLKPDPDQIHFNDIIVGLSHVCRFSGQIDQHYSVGEHSMRVALTVWEETGDPEKALQALLHDASEAYTGDCPSPLKRDLGDAWYDIEDGIQRAIYRKYGVAETMYPEVKEADQRWLVTEKKELQPNGPSWAGTAYAEFEPYSARLLMLRPSEVRYQLHYWFHNFSQRLEKKYLTKSQ